MGNPVGWFEIYVQDMARAKTFYETVLGVQLAKLDNTDMEMWTFAGDQNSYGTPGALVKMDGVPSGGNSVLVYFHSEDCAIEETRIVPAGGQICRSKTSIGPYGFIVLATDTEGNMFGLHSMQ